VCPPRLVSGEGDLGRHCGFAVKLPAIYVSWSSVVTLKDCGFSLIFSSVLCAVLNGWPLCAVSAGLGTLLRLIDVAVLCFDAAVFFSVCTSRLVSGEGGFLLCLMAEGFLLCATIISLAVLHEQHFPRRFWLRRVPASSSTRKREMHRGSAV
jgi:hypothetical protein